MQSLLMAWKREITEADDRIRDSLHRYGPGRNLYIEGVADTYRKCVSELEDYVSIQARHILQQANHEICECCDPTTVDISKLVAVGCHYCSGCGRKLS